MANEEQLSILRQGVEVWNKWRTEKMLADIGPLDPLDPFLAGSGVDSGENDIVVSSTEISATQSETNTNKNETAKKDAYGQTIIDLSDTDLSKRNLAGANLSRANLKNTNLSHANLRNADFNLTDLSNSKLVEARLQEANFSLAKLYEAELVNADISGGNFFMSELANANLSYANLKKADFSQAVLSQAKLIDTNLDEAVLKAANLTEAVLMKTSLVSADLRKAILIGANFYDANLSGANLSNSDLSLATLVRTNLENTNLEGCHVYGCSAWDIKGEPKSQKNLVISPHESPPVTLDDLEMAQFINLLLNNEKLRNVIDTVTSKSVLILGRFTKERKKILDAIRDELRNRNYTPIIFDFKKPTSRDLTETITLLAQMSRFIIADLTDPRSIPQELSQIIPYLPSVPVVPIILSSRTEYGLYEHWRRYPDWVLPIYKYDTVDDLLQKLTMNIILPAEDAVERQKPKRSN